MSAPVLSDDFARALPELAEPWQAVAAPHPRLLILNEKLAGELGLDCDWLRGPDGVKFLTGNAIPVGAAPVAQAYAGHQFGSYVPLLGDGRALLLGELGGDAPRDLHLKGSGRTPFARGGDGLAAVGPMLREYVISEAMHALGVPTTRALAVVATGADVLRETVLPGAVLTRIAASHLRVGSFQLVSQHVRAGGDPGLLRRLADYAIHRHYPDAAQADNPYLALFSAVVDAQASLIARWMLVGFVHGVMNTDNMTISGETIDYGPCAFMDAYDPATVFSSIDHAGRYAYGHQPVIAQWNLARFGETLLPLFAATDELAYSAAVEILEGFMLRYNGYFSAGLLAKFGLTASVEAAGVMDRALALLTDNAVDFTSFFRNVASAGRGENNALPTVFDDWLIQWRALGPDTQAMDEVNPSYIPRNHLVEEALTAATLGDLGAVHTLLDVLAEPYRERPGLSAYAAPAPPEFGTYRTFCGT